MHRVLKIKDMGGIIKERIVKLGILERQWAKITWKQNHGFGIRLVQQYSVCL